MQQNELQVPEQLIKAQSLANLSDTSIRIPLVGWRIGLDAIIGLIPGIGDALMWLLSARIVFLARQMQVPNSIQARMVYNALVDALLGSVPIVGDIFDMVFKANLRNVKLMEKWWLQQHRAELSQHTQAKIDEWKQQQDAD